VQPNMPIWKPFTRWTEIHTVLLTLLISSLLLSCMLRYGFQDQAWSEQHSTHKTLSC